MKKNLKKYHPDIISKDFTIGFFAGLAGGASFWFLSISVTDLLKKNYKALLWDFLAYLAVGTVLWLILDLILRKMFGKKKK